MSLVISNLWTRFGETGMPLVSLEDADVSRFDAYVAHAPSFYADKAPTTGLGVDANGITSKDGWPSTKPDHLVMQGLSLLSALVLTFEDADEAWPRLWLAGLVRPNMVLRAANSEEQEVYYVLMTTDWTVSLWQMAPDDTGGNMYQFRNDPALLFPLETIRDLDVGARELNRAPFEKRSLAAPAGPHPDPPAPSP